MDYKEKLRAFNSTEKYLNECSFIAKLINVHNSIVLDYGCGLGTFMNDWLIDGFDVNDYYEGSYRSNYFNVLPSYSYTDITMIHSIAHINNPIEVLKTLRQRYGATITVITPNAHWLMQQSDKDYKPDPTVVKHYTMTNLRKLFEEAGYEVTLLGQFGEEKYGINERIFLQAK